MANNTNLSNTSGNYSVSEYFGGNNSSAYKNYKSGKAAGKWKDLMDYVSKTPGAKQISYGSSSGSDGGIGGDYANQVNKINQGITSDVQNYLTNARGRYGIPALEQAQQGITNQALGVEGQLEQLPTNVKNESRGFDVNAAQLQSIQQAKAAPLQTTLSGLGRAAERYNTALGNANTAMNLDVGTYAANKAREATGYTEALKTELDNLMEKARQQQALSLVEQQRLWQLADAESKFEKDKQLIEINKQAEIDKYNRTTGSNTSTPTPQHVPSGPQSTQAGGQSSVITWDK